MKPEIEGDVPRALDRKMMMDILLPSALLERRPDIAAEERRMAQPGVMRPSGESLRSEVVGARRALAHV